jgi:hypothetical protein
VPGGGERAGAAVEPSIRDWRESNVQDDRLFFVASRVDHDVAREIAVRFDAHMMFARGDGEATGLHDVEGADEQIIDRHRRVRRPATQAHRYGTRRRRALRIAARAHENGTCREEDRGHPSRSGSIALERSHRHSHSIVAGGLLEMS